MFSSNRQDWKTPIDTYNELDREFHFDFDPCPPNPKFGEHALFVEWGGSNFINPPYNQIGKFLEKGWVESRKGKTCVFLIPSRTDTKWWHEYCMKADRIIFIKGRLKFQGAKNGAPFPSCVVIFKGDAIREAN